MDGSTRLVRSSLSIVLVVSMFFGAALVAGSTLEAQVTWSVVDSVPSSPNGTGTPYDPMLLADMTGDGRDDLFISVPGDSCEAVGGEGTHVMFGSASGISTGRRTCARRSTTICTSSRRSRRRSRSASCPPSGSGRNSAA